jgi:glycosyltransferase involved in cell wall biosynthesis
VQQWLAPGSPHDQQRGPIYAPLFAAAGAEVRYVGRRPIPISERAIGPIPARATRSVRRTVAYRVWYRLLNRVITAINDARIERLASQFDVVLLLKVDSASLIQRLRRSTRARLVYDLADVTHRDATSGILSAILTSVDAVTTDNTLSLAYARRHNSAVHLWPSISYVEHFDRQRHSSRRGRDDRVVLGWVGSDTTAWNLYLIVESLEDVFRDHRKLHLRLLGVPEEHEVVRRFENVQASCLPVYNTNAMIREVINMDIGIFPIFDMHDPAMHGITKALVYMGGGAAVVCSPVGDCRTLVRDRENGLHAVGRAGWSAKLSELICDPALRARLAEEGVRTARSRYSLEECFNSLRAALGV